MSEEEETEVPDYKTKRLEVLARAREVARQNRLAKSSEKKSEHNKIILERKQARMTAQKQVKEKQEKEKIEPEEEEELEETHEPPPDEPPSPKKPLKKSKQKNRRIIVEESSSSESETEEVIFIKKPRKPKKPPPQRVVYRDITPPGSRPEKTTNKQLMRDFRDYFIL